MPRRAAPAGRFTGLVPVPVPILALAGLLAACQPQSLRFSEAEPRLVDIDGWRIAVWRTEGEAQAIRLNAVAGASPAEMLVFGRRAIRRATGCALRERGAAVNPSVLTGRLDCAPAPPGDSGA